MNRHRPDGCEDAAAAPRGAAEIGKRWRPGLRTALWLFVASLAALLVAADRMRPGGRPIIKLAGIDAVCYHALSVSLVTDGDLDLTNQFRRHPPEPTSMTADHPVTGLPGCPFALGFPLLETPFVLAGNLVSRLAGQPGDGYSAIAVHSYFLGILVLLGLGLTGLLALQSAWFGSAGSTPGGAETPVGSRGGAIAAWDITLLLWAGTTLGYYSFSPMSHVAAFMASTFFFLSWLRACNGDSTARWALCGASLGLYVLCRWQGALYLVTPLLYDAGRQIRYGGPLLTRARVISRGAFLLAFGLLIAPQFVMWKVLYGQWLTIPQGEGYFDRLPRHALHVLASSQHGWFTWTPIALLGVIGLAAGPGRDRLTRGSLLAGLAAQVLLLGSLAGSWSGNGYFGMRGLTCSLPLVVIGLRQMDERLARRRRLLFRGLAGLCALYTLAFGLQYRLDLVPRDERLTVEQMFLDKLRLPQALRHRRMLSAARRTLEQGDAGGAAALLNEAVDCCGATPEALDLLIEAHEHEGNETLKQAARERRIRMERRRLF